MNATDLLARMGETSLAVALLIALVLLIRKPVSRAFGAHAAYLLWLAPAARLFLPQLNILPAAADAPGAYAPLDAVVHVVDATATNAGAAVDWLAVAAGAGLFLWASVAFAIIASRITAYRSAYRAARNASIAAPAALIDEAQAVAKALALRATPTIRLCKDESGPMVMGIARPCVYLPASFADRYTRAERRLALAHEFAHIARGDLAAGFAAMALQAAQWPNPLAHLAAGAFRADQEAACDAYVLARFGGRKAAGDYASAIIKSIRTDAPALGMSLGHPLKERLMLLKNTSPSLARRLLGAAGAGALVVAGVGATASYGFAADDSDEAVTDIETTVDADGAVKVVIEKTGGDSALVEEKRVLVFSGGEEEIIFDDMVVGDRVQVMEFEDDSGMKRVVRVKGAEKTVRVIGENGDVLTEEIMRDDGPHMMTNSTCVSGDGEGEPVVLEWKDESEDGDGEKRVSHTVICLTGEDADPDNVAEAMEKAIEQLETSAKREEARRKEMIKALRKQAREIENQRN